MACISFIDDNFRMADRFLKRDYAGLAGEIRRERHGLTCWEAGKTGGGRELLAGFQAGVNAPLSELYEDAFYVVRLAFADADTMHDAGQERILERVFQKLKQHMELQKGYYNIRIPSHVVDAVRAYNSVIGGGCFCGGTVEEIISGRRAEYEPAGEMKVFFGNDAYVSLHGDELMEMTLESFKKYQGQYHISPVTEGKAGKIYENWIRDSLRGCGAGSVVIAENAGAPAGFVTITEKGNAVEGVLSAVAQEHRKCGAYRAMISYIVNYAADRGKSFITSTQFDNFTVQGVWNSIGLRPFYSIYNFHVDTR